MHALGGNQGERVTQIEAHLPPKYAERAGARTVFALSIGGNSITILVKNFAQQILIGGWDALLTRGVMRGRTHGDLTPGRRFLVKILLYGYRGGDGAE